MCISRHSRLSYILGACRAGWLAYLHFYCQMCGGKHNTTWKTKTRRNEWAHIVFQPASVCYVRYYTHVLSRHTQTNTITCKQMFRMLGARAKSRTSFPDLIEVVRRANRKRKPRHDRIRSIQSDQTDHIVTYRERKGLKGNSSVFGRRCLYVHAVAIIFKPHAQNTSYTHL